jgi:acyl carrier protein
MAVLDMGEREIQERLLAFVASDLGASRQGAPVGLDDELLAEGIIDSMGVMQLVLFIEETLVTVVEDEEIVPENFASIRVLAGLVAAKRNGPAPQPL